MRDGLIQDVGENVTVPADAWVIEAEGLTVYPGLIDALSAWGITEPAPAPAPPVPAPAKPSRQQPATAAPAPVPCRPRRGRPVVEASFFYPWLNIATQGFRRSFRTTIDYAQRLPAQPASQAQRIVKRTVPGVSRCDGEESSCI